MTRQRIKWIDYGKAFAIFGVMVIHLNPDPTLKQCINSFIMPLFFFMSGYLFSYENNPDYGIFVKKRFRQLIVPYCWINILAYGIWYFITRHFGIDPRDAVEWYMPIIGIFSGIPPFLYHNIPLWSLVSFFVVECIFYPICRKWNNPVVIASIFAILNALLYYSHIKALSLLPLALGPSISALIFYSLGYGVKHSKMLFRTIYLLLALPCFCLSIRLNTIVDFYICKYGIYLLYIVSAISGSYIVIYVSHIISSYWTPKIIIFISKSTLIICGFHLIAYAFIKGIMLLAFGVEPQEYLNSTFSIIVFALCSFFITLPIAYYIQKYLRFLVDK